ncbi:hypothetical protein [Halomonas sp. PR-M31]|uniref:hypothetical protein n=1 Tax=Halomonas sp. PR-M31 TaxID=1471202 RepID=UPI000A8FE6DE
MNTPLIEIPTAQPRIDMGELSSYASGPALMDIKGDNGCISLRWNDASQAHFPGYGCGITARALNVVIH